MYSVNGRFNRLLVTDTQHQDSASRRLLCAGQRRSYMFRLAARRTVALVLGFVCASGVMAQTWADDLDPMPPWDIGELVAGATRTFGLTPAASVRLLAWQSVEGAGQFRIDSALLWARFPYQDRTGDERVQWKLLSMFRHPRNQLKIWRASVITHTFLGDAGFAYPPKAKDVYDFVEVGHWKHSPEQGYVVLGRGVRANTWKDVIGEVPPLSLFGDDVIGK